MSERTMIGCKTLLSVILPADERSERERLFTYSPIDLYRVTPRDLPLLDGATRLYWHERGGWYIAGTAKSYPLEFFDNEYEPFLLDAGTCSKLAVYLKADVLPYQAYNTFRQLLEDERKSVWLIEEYPSGKERQFFLFRLSLSAPFSSSFVTFLPDEQDAEHFIQAGFIEHDIRVTLFRKQPGIL